VWTLRLNSRPGASRTARSWLRDSLTGVAARGGADLHTSVVSDAVLCVSELVNASLRAGSTTMLLEVHCDEHSLRLSLRDDGTTPNHRQRGGAADHWGMLFIEAAAQCMGIEPHGYGRELWARLSVDQQRGSRAAGR
jgi:anti-sigma regulatory factor (Ser/Thr protein kinase)